ncbi:MAG: hypothetical protein LBH80_07290 [Prevotellaceae bacterium]|nr:hypothetical protein [Prevotellaceae bacterium]
MSFYLCPNCASDTSGNIVDASAYGEFPAHFQWKGKRRSSVNNKPSPIHFQRPSVGSTTPSAASTMPSIAPMAPSNASLATPDGAPRCVFGEKAAIEPSPFCAKRKRGYPTILGRVHSRPVLPTGGG